MSMPGFTAEASLLNQLSKTYQFPSDEAGQDSKQVVIPQMRRECVPTCMCWPDGCLCFWDCTGGRLAKLVK